MFHTSSFMRMQRCFLNPFRYYSHTTPPKGNDIWPRVERFFAAMNQSKTDRRKRAFMWITGGGIAVGGGYWLFKEQIHDRLGVNGANVGMHVLEDKGLQQK